MKLCHGATSIASCEVKEGGNNRVFNFTTDRGQRLVAKLPFAHAGPARFATLSEVATVHYGQSPLFIVAIPLILYLFQSKKRRRSPYLRSLTGLTMRLTPSDLNISSWSTLVASL